MGADYNSYFKSGAGSVGGILTSLGHGKETRKSNAFYQRLFNTGNLMNRAGQINPWLFYALGGQTPRGGWGRAFNKDSGIMGDLQKIVNGQDISPYLLNQPLNQINQGYNQNIARAQALIGRIGGQGGLANAYALANQGGRNNAIADQYQKYGTFREQQRRADIDWIFNQTMGAQNAALNQASAYGNKWTQPNSTLTTIGNGFLGYAGMGPSFMENHNTNAPVSTFGNQGQPSAYDQYLSQGNANQWNSWGSGGATGVPASQPSSWGYQWPQGGNSSSTVQSGTPNWYNANKVSWK